MTLSIGVLGLAAASLNAFLFREATSGPGDDNAIGLLFLAGLCGSVIPIRGLWMRRRVPGIFDWVWLAASGLVLAVFLVFVGGVFHGALV